jgi:LAS superfamily LD-carboxypeptidase LdcB
VQFLCNLAVIIGMKIRLSFVVLFISLSTLVFGQTKKKEKAEPSPSSQQPSSLSPSVPQQTQQPLTTKTKSKSKSPKLEVTYDPERKFYQRTKEVSKERIKAEKEMQKPQYSDPMYFGHKRPPKKRPIGKQKYCKECGMKH